LRRRIDGRNKVTGALSDGDLSQRPNQLWLREPIHAIPSEC
jgi:hypothetical protein